MNVPPGTRPGLEDVMEPVVGTIEGETEAQTALRRLAMMIARREPCEAVLHGVALEAARRFRPAAAGVIRYEHDGRTTLVAGSTSGSSAGGWGGRLPSGLTATVQRSGRFAAASDGNRIAAAAPVHLDGLLWGLVAVVREEAALPPASEHVLAELGELVATAVADEQRQAELMASRARLVAASDESRRRIERDLHDGTQQYLITLVLRLRSVSEMPAVAPAVRIEIEDIAAELTGVLDDLRELSRGIHPAVLTEGGLRPALRALARRSTVPVLMEVFVHRLPEPVEVAAYHVVSEVLANAAKHVRASTVEVDAVISDGLLHMQVRDDGVGGADLARGSGLIALRDRIEALGGTFAVNSEHGGGTVVTCRLPVAPLGVTP